MLSGRLVRRALGGLRAPLSSARRHGATGVRTMASNVGPVVDSSLSTITIPTMTIQEKLLQEAEKWPDHTAIECCMSGRQYSYSQLDEFSKRVAAGFLKSGLKPGQVVSFVLPNIPEFMIALLGALRAGLIVSTINPIYAPDEIAYQLTNSDSALVITFLLKTPEVQAAVGKLSGPKPPICIIHPPSEEIPEDTRSFMELLMVEDEEVEQVDKIKSSPDDCAFLLYSSGTTGLPKGVRLTHRNIVSNICQVSHPDMSPINPTSAEYQDTVACVLPFFHVYGLVVGGLSYLSGGCKLLTLPRFEPELFLKALKEDKTNVVHVVPPLVQFLANHPTVTREHLDTLRHAINGAASVSVSDAKKLLEKKNDLKLTSGYGLTESSPVIAAAKRDSDVMSLLASVGVLACNTTVKLLDTESGELVKPGQAGEICVKGPQVMSGYHKNKEATDATIKDGWLHTGDVGHFDDSGNLYIVDRIKELIKVKGFQVAPLEIEEILREHKGVADCGVVGKPDSRFGEVPVAFVVPSQGSKPSEKELQDHVAGKVAEYKQIAQVVFIDEIPKNLTGKILRKQLKERLTG